MYNFITNYSLVSEWPPCPLLKCLLLLHVNFKIHHLKVMLGFRAMKLKFSINGL